MLSFTKILEFAICDSSLLIRKLYNIHAKSLGLNVLDRRALIHIYYRPELTQVELSQHLEIEAQNLIRVLDRLVDLGFIEKSQHPKDRRAKCLKVTVKGKKTLDELNQKVAVHYDEIFTNIDDETQKTLVFTLETLKDNLSRVLRQLDT
ncbi:MAG: MarR family winged helix-turn-helix transcriptional regulator [Francisellaceae bacterium]